MVSIPKLYPYASNRLLYPDTSTEPLDAAHVQLCFHTMAGYLWGSESQWKTNGADGVRSHFGLGGSKDAPADDGKLVQWVPLNRRAYAQNGGNPYCISVETSDGAVKGLPWSEKQLDQIVKLIVWFTKLCGRTQPQLANAPGEQGTITYHQQFQTFNKNNHDCPGSVRRHQLVEIAIPRAREIMRFGPVKPTTEDEMTPAEVKTAAYDAIQRWATERHDPSSEDNRVATLREMLDDFPEVKQRIDANSEAIEEVRGLVQQVLDVINTPPPPPPGDSNGA